MNRKLLKVCENLGWIITDEDSETVYLNQGSPLGEDFGFSASKKNFVNDIRDFYQDFDPEQHAAGWYELRNSVNGVPQSIRALLKDADRIDDMLEKLTIALVQAETKLKRRKKQ